MDYEEALLQVTDVLKAHNRHHLTAPDHEQAVNAIRDIVTPKGKWIIKHANGCNYYICSECNLLSNDWDNFCPNCGARMEK